LNDAGYYVARLSVAVCGFGYGFAVSTTQQYAAIMMLPFNLCGRLILSSNRKTSNLRQPRLRKWSVFLQL